MRQSAVMRPLSILAVGLIAFACGSAPQTNRAMMAGTTGGSTGGISGSGDPGSGTWRPFSNDSPWNTKIPANPELDPDSAAMIADFAVSSPYGQKLDINMKQWSIPLFYADASTPRVQVRADLGGLGFASSDGSNATAMVPIPPEAVADSMEDGSMAIIDRVNLIEWDFYQGRKDGSGWRCTLCANIGLTGTGVRPFKPTNPTWYTSHGTRACGFPLVAGLIRAEAVRAGRIDHALAIAYPHIRAGLYTPPASTAQVRIGDQAIHDPGHPLRRSDPAGSHAEPGQPGPQRRGQGGRPRPAGVRGVRGRFQRRHESVRRQLAPRPGRVRRRAVRL